MGLFSKKTKIIRPHVTAIVAAAGSSSRMGGENKLLLPLLGTPVIAYTLLALEQCAEIDEIVIAALSESIITIGDICKEFSISKVTQIISGGATRTETVYSALMNVSAETEYAAIHDGARPLVKPQMISELVKCALMHSAAVPIVPLKDTIKIMDGTLAVSTPARSSLGAVQTPQVFELGLIRGALTKAIQEQAELTDDAQAIERMGIKIMSVDGHHSNIKITTPEDIAIAEALLIAGQGAL